jgi:DNA-binding IclR family transcriptional regulator
MDEILEILARDRAWHSLDEIANRATLPKQETADIVWFLALYRFIVLKEHGNKARIRAGTSSFLEQIKKEERHSAM